jgi:hypothetical protein
VNTRAAHVLAGALLVAQVLAAAPVAAATYRVDDSASIPRESTALLGWRSAVPSRNRDDTLQGTIGVALRLDIGAWNGRTGRIYLVLPEQAIPGVRLKWRTQGRLLSGQAIPGQRVLVFEGSITTPYLEDRLELDIEASGRELLGTQPLGFHFEIDVD